MEVTADVGGDIYMRMPKGFKLNDCRDQHSHVLKLIKNLYGLKQSGRVWNQHLHPQALPTTTDQSDPNSLGFNKHTKPKETTALSSKILQRDEDGLDHETVWDYQRIIGKLTS